jgi:hypothetical protein
MTVNSFLLAHGLLPLAYLDGGTGSMLIQAALAGVLSAAYMIKIQWQRIRTAVSKRSSHSDSPRG